jgi:solute carrier family 25 citrate transporter 1
MQDVWRRHGWKGFYRGVAIASTGGFAKSMTRMGMYDRLKRSLQSPDGSLTGGRALLAGIGAGLTETVVVVVPMETAKTKLIHATLLPRDHAFYSMSNSSMNAVRTLHSIGGMRVLYAGLTATLLRQMTAAMTRFGTYQSLKNIVGGSVRPGQKLPSGITFGLGAISGVATVAVTMPFDVVKTRMQSIGARQRYRNTWWCMVQTVQEEGMRTLWRGSTMRLCRLTLSGAVTFFVYEEMISLAGHS